MLKEQIKLLVKLQDVYTESALIESNLSNVTNQIETLNVNLESFEKDMNDQEAIFNERNKKYRSLDADSKTIVSNIAKSKAKLGLAKTNKEYQASLKEIEDLETQFSQLEDDAIRLLDLIDDSKDSIVAKKIEFAQLSKKVKADKQAIKQEAKSNKDRLSKLIVQKEKIIAKIDKDLYEKFSILKTRISYGPTIVQVENGACRGCNMNIPPQLYNDVQRCDQLLHCPFCQRIIYWKKIND